MQGKKDKLTRSAILDTVGCPCKGGYMQGAPPAPEDPDKDPRTKRSGGVGRRPKS